MIVLAADVGGTKTRLGVFDADQPRQPLQTKTLVSADYPDLRSLCQAFLDGLEHEVHPDSAAVGVPGPVVDGRAHTTNLPWTVDAARLRSALGVSRVDLFNDLVAIGRSIPLLAPDDVQTLIAGDGTEGDPREDPIAVVAPGTGLGVAYGIPDRRGYRVVASEGGHTDFAPTDALQEGLLEFLRAEFSRVSYERVCSGSGLPHVYRYLRAQDPGAESEAVRARLAAAGDPTPIIVQAALDGDAPCGLCRETVRLFVSILGAKAGNEALAVVATGGVYLAGGIPPRILSALEGPDFARAFLAKGRMRPLLERIPVRVVLTPEAPLMGAVQLALEAWQEES